MPRPTKCRKVCHFPKVLEFLPAHADIGQPRIFLTLDEYEAIRLIDKEGLSQEACGEWMQVARTTVQKIYESARKKLAEALVEGAPLCIGSRSAMGGPPAGAVWTASSGSTISNMKSKKEMLS